MFDDHPWNLVVACRECNRVKADLLAPAKLVDRLIERDGRCAQTMQVMRTSLAQLSPGEETGKARYAATTPCVRRIRVREMERS